MGNNPVSNIEELADNLGKVAYSLDKAYMSRLREDYDVIPFSEYLSVVNSNNGSLEMDTNIRALRVRRFVYDKDELIRDGFKNVLGLFSGGSHNVALIIRRTPAKVTLDFVVKNENSTVAKPANTNVALLRDSFVGNFNGTEIELIKSNGTGAILDFEDANAVSLLCGIPSEKSEDYISQGIEKLLNGIVPSTEKDSYTCVLLAQPMSISELRNTLTGYESIASALTPFAGKQIQFGKSQTDTSGESTADSHSTGTSHTKNSSHNLGVAISAGMSFGFSVFGSATAGFAGSGVTAGASASVSTNIGITGNYGYTFGKSDTDSINDTLTVGTNKSVAVGDSESTTFSHKSYMISGLVEKLEATIKRINESQATGLWRTAIYVMSENSEVSTNAANFLNSIMQGDSSYLEPPFIQTWYKFDKGDSFKNILQYVKHITHPIFENKIDRNAKVLPTANVSTSELSNLFAFPRYSVQGLPVVECARFGREPHSLIELKTDVNVGCAYHMHTKEKNNRVFLGKDEMTKHTFITGSTGSGKSNTIFKLIEQLCPTGSGNTKFLVIEPAKGEYKDVFGGREDVTVFGTNPFKSPNLLQINPFSFPDDTHVLEHIDHLVEVFNACWPMYAAMPAILKESVEKSYEECGWNLKTSKRAGAYPTFDMLLSILPKVVDSSAYSADTSNDYKGALVTRIRSLTRGIHGQIFKSDVPNETLFNSNVIVDLSRIGSQETKALIMGILVLKLQEFRMSEDVEHNSGLRHITVLEEAHNLLRRTSSEQSQESSNLQGKSVEMLANAIAEMRTYGEGFIIADQSPGLMDMSVIRNTNTKIIMRLPDESDRRLVGKAAGLNDSQVDELSRLEQGVAAISQSDWLEPVLCKIDEFTDKQSVKDRFKTDAFDWTDDENSAIQQFLSVALDVEHIELTKDVVDKVRNWYGILALSPKARDVFENVLEANDIDDRQKLLLVYYVVGGKLKDIVVREDAITEVNQTLLGKYGVEENSEVIRRINELFLLYFPLNTVLDNTIEPVEKLGRH
ncbi:MAG: DUF87 domain-containing protein [Oscillospiraceae bacterium]|nr:DUF87 domain-containing protein [Oscillospiraceae bacterium]